MMQSRALSKKAKEQFFNTKGGGGKKAAQTPTFADLNRPYYERQAEKEQKNEQIAQRTIGILNNQQTPSLTQAQQTLVSPVVPAKQNEAKRQAVDFLSASFAADEKDADNAFMFNRPAFGTREYFLQSPVQTKNRVKSYNTLNNARTQFEQTGDYDTYQSAMRSYGQKYGQDELKRAVKGQVGEGFWDEAGNVDAAKLAKQYTVEELQERQKNARVYAGRGRYKRVISNKERIDLYNEAIELRRQYDSYAGSLDTLMQEEAQPEQFVPQGEQTADTYKYWQERPGKIAAEHSIEQIRETVEKLEDLKQNTVEAEIHRLEIALNDIRFKPSYEVERLKNDLAEQKKLLTYYENEIAAYKYAVTEAYRPQGEQTEEQRQYWEQRPKKLAEEYSKEELYTWLRQVKNLDMYKNLPMEIQALQTALANSANDERREQLQTQLEQKKKELQYIENELKAIEAAVGYDYRNVNFLTAAGDAAKQALENVGAGLENAYDAPFIALQKGTDSRGLVNAMLARNEAREERQQKTNIAHNQLSKGQQIAANLIGGSAQLVPTIALSAINPALGTALIATQSFGNSYGEAIQNGASDGEAWGYGLLSAIAEVTVEKAFGGIPLLGNGYVDKALEKLFNSGATQRFIKYAFDTVGEGAEEVVTEVLSPMFKRMTYDPDAELPTFEELAMAFGGGVVGSAIFGGGSLLADIVGSNPHSRGNNRSINSLRDGVASNDNIPSAYKRAAVQQEADADYNNPLMPDVRNEPVDTTATGSISQAAEDVKIGMHENAERLGTPENTARFAERVNKVFMGELSYREVIEVGNTPEILLQYGAKNRKVTITPSAMYKIAYPARYLGNSADGHNLGIPALKHLPEQIADPVAILKSNTQDHSFVILTEWNDTNGKAVIVPIHLDKQGKIDLENRVVSAYGTNSDAVYAPENVLYTKNNEDINQLVANRLQLPSSTKDDIFNNNISQERDIVNNNVRGNAENDAGDMQGVSEQRKLPVYKHGYTRFEGAKHVPATEMFEIVQSFQKKQPEIQRAQQRLNGIMQNAVNTLGLGERFGSAKSQTSTIEKVVRKRVNEGKADYSIDSMKDNARGAIMLKSYDQAKGTVEYLMNKAGLEQPGVEVKNDDQSGYFGIHVTGKLNGVNVEIQLHTKEAWDIKLKSDEVYHKWRNVNAGTLPKWKYRKMQEDLAGVKKLYDDYFAELGIDRKDFISAMEGMWPEKTVPKTPLNGTQDPSLNSQMYGGSSESDQHNSRSPSSDTTNLERTSTDVQSTFEKSNIENTPPTDSIAQEGEKSNGENERGQKPDYAKIQNLYNQKQALQRQIEQLSANNETDSEDYVTLKKQLHDVQAQINAHEQGRRHRFDEEVKQDTVNSDMWKSHNGTLLLNLKTFDRIWNSIAENTEEARRLTERYATPISKAAAKQKRHVAELYKRIMELKLTKGERTAVQFFGEYDGNMRELTAAMQKGELTEQQQTRYDELQARKAELENDKSINMEKVQRGIQEFRAVYNELIEQANQVLMGNGYKPISYRKNYFPHFNTPEPDSVLGKIGRVLGMKMDIADLPGDLAGKTHEFKPGKQWFANEQQRKGYQTEYDAVEGFKRYVNGVTSIIYQTENIQRLRALERELRSKYSDAGRANELNEIDNDSTLSPEEKMSRMEDVRKRELSHLNSFVTWLNDYTNVLAGKKAFADRPAEQKYGRSKVYNLAKFVDKNLGFTMVVGNMYTALTNSGVLQQAQNELHTEDFLRGFYDTVKSQRRDDGFRDRSDFLTNRAGLEALYPDKLEAFSNILNKPMDFIDLFSAEAITRARYYENMRWRGMDEDAALAEADVWARNKMAEQKYRGNAAEISGAEFILKDYYEVSA